MRRSSVAKQYEASCRTSAFCGRRECVRAGVRVCRGVYVVYLHMPKRVRARMRVCSRAQEQMCAQVCVFMWMRLGACACFRPCVDAYVWVHLE